MGLKTDTTLIMTNLSTRIIISCLLASLAFMFVGSTIFAQKACATTCVSAKVDRGIFVKSDNIQVAHNHSPKSTPGKIKGCGAPVSATPFAEPTTGAARLRANADMAGLHTASNLYARTYTATPLYSQQAKRSARGRARAAAETTAAADGDDSESAFKGCEPLRMAVKTNMLYDALTVPNIGVEFYLGGGWSAAAGAAYSWWSNSTRHRYFRVYGGDIAIRKWFGARAKATPLTGHHIGVYGQLFTYDVEFGGKGYMGGRPGGKLWDEPQAAGGVEYGYSLPIAHRLCIDLAVGVGYWYGKTREYKPVDGGYEWLKTNHRNYLGPTKAEISFVWLLGRGYSKKGGEQ